ncbi:FixH family protein [Tumebacillus permanentifrigoris]|uniref:YtkA-like protein n=1 Tax=Tumebacillus permanentifrigoris TaxID=378543 RepID=A0A316D6F2_9BACL|nr:FixH family protein [Tumebacillus permanentifrigoris]PWK06995.1 YtkA-like protein [Tumebacillus permanentifrigoris]
MKRMLLLAPALALALMGCSSTKTEPLPAKPSVPVIVFKTNPEPMLVNQAGDLTATVMVNSDPVKKATVEFEIWEEGNNTPHETIPAQGDDKGHYTVHKSFAKATTYQVTIHTTTEEIHTMPTMNFTVVEAAH